MMLKELCEIYGASGNEGRVREYILEKIAHLCDEISTDSMGNVIAIKRGTTRKKVMLAAHMDEVGIIISAITSDGYLKFKPIGGLDPRVLLAQRVVIGEKNIPGVIGIKAVHMVDKPDREKTVQIKDMYIDIGAKSRDEAEQYVEIGDFGAFDSKYIEFGDGCIKCKALDDRAGCAILIEVLQQNKVYDFDLYACFTVQEESGLRGATIAAARVNPDVGIALETTTCADVAGVLPHENVTTFGGGAAINILDGASFSNHEMYKMLHDIGVKNNIPVQYKRSMAGGNDAGVMQTAGSGAKTAVVSIPCKYIHSAVSVISKKDYTASLEIIKIFLQQIGGKIND